ncbi:hypothetical protein RUND412_006804 [Rhizina undulata]
MGGTGNSNRNIGNTNSGNRNSGNTNSGNTTWDQSSHKSADRSNTTDNSNHYVVINNYSKGGCGENANTKFRNLPNLASNKVDKPGFIASSEVHKPGFIASTKFFDGNGLHLRVYYQDTYGNIRESYWDQGRGWNLRGDGIIVKAKLNSPIAVVSWASGVQIRAYYLNEQDCVCEKVYSGGSGWTDGGLNSYKLQAAPYSQLAAAQIGEGSDLRIHIYYQDPTNKLREHIWDSGWYNGSNTLPVALNGTSLSSFALASSPGCWWLFYQDNSLKLKETYYTPGNRKYIAGGYSPTGNFRPGASISAVAWGHTEIRVFAVNKDNQLIETAFQGNRWTGTKALTATVTDSGVAAIQWPNVQIRVYHQRIAENLKELCWDGSQWVSGADVPQYAD